MKTTCGIFIINNSNELLVCRATGSNNFSIPKGELEENNENPLDRALIETFEEANIDLFKYKNKLISLGSNTYKNKKKKLIAYSIKISSNFQNKQDLKCESYFEYKKHGKTIKKPEVDYFEWIHIDAVIKIKKIHEAQLQLLSVHKSLISKQETQI